MTPEMIETSKSRMWFDEDGILHVVNRPGCHFDIQSARENSQSVQVLLKGRKVAIAVDLRGTASISKEAREYYAGQEIMDSTIATALIIDSPVGRIIGNFFIGLNKPCTPVRLCESEEAAILWLKAFLE